MAADGYDAEPADLHGAAPRFGTAGRDLHAAIDTLHSTLSGLGDYLGSDEQGQAFKGAYEPKVTEAQDAARAIGDKMTGIEPRLQSAAQQYEGDDGGARGDVDRTVRG